MLMPKLLNVILMFENSSDVIWCAYGVGAK